jgi:hypothetical protein
MVEGRLRIRTAQREGIEIAKSQGKFKGGMKKYHARTTGKDKVIFDRIVQLLASGMSVMDIHREVDVARNTIYRIKRELNFETSNSVIDSNCVVVMLMKMCEECKQVDLDKPVIDPATGEEIYLCTDCFFYYKEVYW